jgi:hypothetical protein
VIFFFKKDAVRIFDGSASFRGDLTVSDISQINRLQLLGDVEGVEELTFKYDQKQVS